MPEGLSKINREVPPPDLIDQVPAALFLVAFGVSFYRGYTLPEGDPTRRILAGGLMLLIVGNAMYVAFCWIQSRSRRGRVLLDCKYQPDWRSSLVAIVILVWVVLGSSTLSFFEELFPHADLFFGLLLVLGLTFFTFARFQVLSNGLWHYGTFLPWEKIETWGWSDASRTQLVIRLRRKIPVFRRKEAPLRRGLRDEVERLLEEHLERVQPS